jgi:ribosomal-protein-alanine N-acetyltransferase
MQRRVQKVELIEIGADGTPKEDVGPLSSVAADACAKTAAHYTTAGFSPPWISFLARCNSEVVGICAFTSAPCNGRVEIAYHTFPAFEGRGVATVMVTELLTRARRFDPKVELFAHTLTEENASTVILRNLGFEFVGALDNPEGGLIWEWRRKAST